MTGLGKWISVVIILLCVGAVLFAMRDTGPDTDMPTALVQKGDLQVIVQTLGRIDAARSRSISPRLPGDKAKIVWIIEDGTFVKPGDILVRFDKTQFEESIRSLESKLDTQQSVTEAFEQAAAWEESQAEREIRSIEFDMQVARMEADQLENGDGPLELAQRKDELNEAGRKYNEISGYIKELEVLVEKGVVDAAELNKAREELQAAALKLEVVKQKYKSFSEYVFPAKLKMAQAKKARAKLAYEEMVKASGFRIGQARAKVEEARRQENHYRDELKKARRMLADTVIKAPEQGLVVLVERHYEGELRKPRVGDVAWQGQPLVYLPDLSRMVVQTQVREIDLHKVHEGQSVQVALDAFPELRIDGEISHIGILAHKKKGIHGLDKVFNMTVTLNGHDDRLRPGMNARVKIICATRKQVANVPLNAVFGDAGDYWCYVPGNDGWRRQPVKVGVIGDQAAEILEGLSEGQMVALVEPSSR